MIDEDDLYILEQRNKIKNDRDKFENKSFLQVIRKYWYKVFFLGFLFGVGHFLAYSFINKWFLSLKNI